MWEPDYHEHKAYSVLVEDKTFFDRDETEPDEKPEAFMIINVKQNEDGSYVGPGRLIAILEAQQGLVVKSLCPIPRCSKEEVA